MGWTSGGGETWTWVRESWEVSAVGGLAWEIGGDVRVGDES